ncbi:MAG: hypothetical protein Pg6A_15860 [Termitinemataceae bacterium]|nr:MAG: hypothetical protein Pg6A_15860 [Termitinemataceae bacterium]
MPILRDIMRKQRMDYFIRYIGENDKILEIGSGDSWFKDFLYKSGRRNYLSIDIENESADIMGDILLWRELGLAANSFDVIVAFEVVEHVDCFEACFDLLKKNGRLLLTTPVPHMDWILRIMEAAGLNQKRTSPHNHLVYLKNAPGTWAEKKLMTGGGG